jgi:hypothetical protein
LGSLPSLPLKEKAKELKEEKKVALALAALEVPTSKGVVWHTQNASWKVLVSAHGKQWYLGRFDFDDHTEAVALYKRHKSKTKTELEALTLENRQQTTATLNNR